MTTANIRKKLGLVKSVDTASKTVVAHVSTFGWDRMNERFDKGAWDLTNYLSNPVVLWGHDSTSLPIGKALKVTEDEFGLLTETQFDDQSEEAMKIFGLYERGFLNAFSVGFIPKKWAFEAMAPGAQEKGLVYQEAELLEYSAVSIPANPGAVVSREVGELVIKTLGDGLVTPVQGADGFVINPVSFKEEPFVAPEEKEIVKAVEPTPLESLTQLIEVVKTAKGSKLDKTTVEAMGHCVALFQEIIAENSEAVRREDFEQLKSAVSGLSEVVKNLYPDAAEVVRRIMSQVDKALRGRAA